jgi:DHA2 family methylenomycin A resistance protein-like MFS transporter
VAVTVPHHRARRLGLAAICLGFLMITTDTTIVNVAVGPIVADLGGSLSAAQWIVSGYTIAFATFLLSAGALADRIGSRVAFVAGLTLFGVASAACAAAPSIGTLIAARALQGLGAAALMPVRWR